MLYCVHFQTLFRILQNKSKLACKIFLYGPATPTTYPSDFQIFTQPALSSWSQLTFIISRKGAGNYSAKKSLTGSERRKTRLTIWPDKSNLCIFPCQFPIAIILIDPQWSKSFSCFAKKNQLKWKSCPVDLLLTPLGKSKKNRLQWKPIDNSET